ncbi:MAG: restriction endonuclease subunit S, partial [Candidatus Dechloromonas phosphoritropha]
VSIYRVKGHWSVSSVKNNPYSIQHPKPDRLLGDILLTKVGTTGIAVQIDTDRTFSIFVSVALLKLPVKAIGKFLELSINSPFVRSQSEEGTEGVGNKNLVLRKISAFMLPLPPLAEQHRIVAKVDELLALCDRLKAELGDSRARQERLAATLIESALRAA